MRIIKIRMCCWFKPGLELWANRSSHIDLSPVLIEKSWERTRLHLDRDLWNAPWTNIMLLLQFVSAVFWRAFKKDSHRSETGGLRQRDVPWWRPLRRKKKSGWDFRRPQISKSKCETLSDCLRICRDLNRVCVDTSAEGHSSRTSQSLSYWLLMSSHMVRPPCGRESSEAEDGDDRLLSPTCW